MTLDLGKSEWRFTRNIKYKLAFARHCGDGDSRLFSSSDRVFRRSQFGHLKLLVLPSDRQLKYHLS